MGKKQRLKQERRQAQAAGPAAAAAAPRQHGYWLLGLLLFAALLIGAIIWILQANRSRILQATLQASAAEVMDQLATRAGKLTFQQSRDLRGMVAELTRLAAAPGLDARSVAHMQFLFGVIREILQEGNMEASELAKLQNQVRQLETYLQARNRPPDKKAVTPAP